MTHEQELIEAYLQGLRHENERIITLLEEHIDPKVWDSQMLTIAWCIALIKGEQK